MNFQFKWGILSYLGFKFTIWVLHGVVKGLNLSYTEWYLVLNPNERATSWLIRATISWLYQRIDQLGTHSTSHIQVQTKLRPIRSDFRTPKPQFMMNRSVFIFMVNSFPLYEFILTFRSLRMPWNVHLEAWPCTLDLPQNPLPVHFRTVKF